MSDTLEQKNESRCFNGRLRVYAHQSESTGTGMKFSVFLPEQAESKRCPALFYLAGLECTHETFVQKAGAQRLAAKLGLILIAPDTSPRGANVPGEETDWDLGTSASFYLDATQQPWAPHYRMGSYINRELPALITAALPVREDALGIMGHSMGGHGALISAFRNPGQWKSLSAIAPISNPIAVPWGKKAFTAYLGSDEAAWAGFDASMLMAKTAFPGTILVDQGLGDKFLEPQLHPQALEAAASQSGQALKLRRHEGYDHSYWFIQTIIKDHIRHHAEALKG